MVSLESLGIQWIPVIYLDPFENKNKNKMGIIISWVQKGGFHCNTKK